MKKFLLYFVGVFLALILIANVGAAFFLGSMVKSGINRTAPRLTQTRVVLQGARISPFTGSGTLTDLSVDNPEGWSSGKAFYLGLVHIELKPFSLFKDHVIIDQLVIDQAEISYETTLLSSNIKDLVKNIESAVHKGHKESDATEPNDHPVKFEVRHFRLTNGKVTLGVGVAAMPLDMPPIELNDLGTAEGGITADQLALAIMKSLTSGVVSAATHSPVSTAGKTAIESVKKTGEEIKKLFGAGK